MLIKSIHLLLPFVLSFVFTCGAFGQTKTQESPDDPKYFSKVQKALVQLGYDPGPINGRMDARTRAAIVAFQKKVGLQPTGKNSETLRDYLYAYTLPVVRNEQTAAVSDSADCFFSYSFTEEKGEINIGDSPESCLPEIRKSVAKSLTSGTTPRMLIMPNAGWEPFDTNKPILKLF